MDPRQTASGSLFLSNSAVAVSPNGLLRVAGALARKQKAHSLASFDGFGRDEAIPRVIADESPTCEQVLVAVKKRLTSFKLSGHNPEGHYWWVRDSEGLRKCWISGGD